MSSSEEQDTAFRGGNGRDPSASVTFIDVLFAVVVSLGLAKVMTQPWFKCASWNAAHTITFEILVILIGYSTLLLSWWGYHKSVFRKVVYAGTWAGRLLFVVDILILAGYWLLLVNFESLLFVLCVLTAIYFMYFCWDWLRWWRESEISRDRLQPWQVRETDGGGLQPWRVREIRQERRQRRRRGVTTLWMVVLLVAVISYAVLERCGLTLTPVDWGFVVLAHAVNFIYRSHKEHLRPLWVLDLLTFKLKREEPY